MTDIYLVTQAFMDYDKEDKKNYCLINFTGQPKKHRKVFRIFGMDTNPQQIFS